MSKREAPILFMRTCAGSLVPVSAQDAEMVDALPHNVDLEVTAKHRKRSVPQLRLYWKMLREVVKATDKFPSSQHLHDEIKMALGYIEKRITFDGRIYYRPDSTAFEKMDAAEFRVFFDRAIQLITTHLGIDPMSFYEVERVS